MSIDIKKLEINLFKTSEINDNDTILVKIDDRQRLKFTKENIQYIYNEVKKMVKKDISIYFFPKSLSIDIVKNNILNIETNKTKILEENKKNK